MIAAISPLFRRGLAMTRNPAWTNTKSLLIVAFLTLLGLPTLWPSCATAQDVDKINGSLKLVGENAAIYSSMLRNREQIEAIGKSKAWAKLWNMPVVKMAWGKVQEEWKNPAGPLGAAAKFYAEPENQELVEVLADMVSHEVFLSGGEKLTSFAELAVILNSSMRFGPAFAKLAGNDEQDPSILQGKILLQSLAENIKLLRIPDLIIGFKLSKTKPAQAQLARLETLLKGLADQVPELKGRVKKAKIGDAETLVVTLDGKLVPWDKVPLDRFEDKPGQYTDLLNKLKGMKLTIALTIRDGYLVLAIGDSLDHLAKLGTGKSLATRPELKPLGKFADKRLISVSYVSKEFAAAVGASKKDIDDMVEAVATNILKNKVPPEKLKQIRKDMEGLAKDVKKLIPEPGATLGFSFLNGRGIESYSYSGRRFDEKDGAQPLTLLDHVGGSPLLAIVGRHTISPHAYESMVKWLKVGYGHFVDIVVPQMDADDKAEFEKFSKIVLPLLEKADAVTGKMLLPALADGQSAFVLDGKLRSKQWHPILPESDKPMPMLEPAVVLGVSDAALLKKAAGEYRSIVNSLIAKLHDEKPDQIPKLEIPEPEVKKVKSGSIYSYALPPNLGVDAQIAPSAGLSEKVLAFTISHSHAERLLTITPLKISGGPLADRKRPLLGAVYVDCAGLMDALGPWIDFGARAALERFAPVEEQDKVNDILKQVQTGLEILNVFRGYTSASYFEDGKLVTHGETIIQDLK
jgi:hypothetical protein